MKTKSYRIYVEKNVPSQSIYGELTDTLGIKSLKSIRVLSRYDCIGISDETFSKAKKTIFAEPNDYIFEEIDFSLMAKTGYLIRELQTGTYDQRADSCEQCLKMLSPESTPKVKCATVFLLEGFISKEEYEKIQKYLINPVEARIGSEALSDFSDIAEIPEDVIVIDGFTDFSEEQLSDFIRDNGLAMSLPDLKFIREHFQSVKRNPTITEIKVIDTYWSDHCRHTTFTTIIDDVKFAGDTAAVVEAAWNEYLSDREKYYGDRLKDKPVTLMDIGTLAAKKLKAEGMVSDIDVSEEINACSVNVEANIDGKKIPYLVMFKNETHNHPTEIEPFGGAATCLGGAIRDPLSGRSYVYQAMRVTGSADPTVPITSTIPGKLPQRTITVGAANGYSSYGNQIGLATGCVDEVYHAGYMAKRMEIGAVIAAAPKENIVRERPIPGDVVLLIGGRTGRDGIGGATGASKAHTKESLKTCGAEVQKGNPVTERKIQRLFRNPEVAKMIKRCNDFGAGGVSVAVGELADGLLINLDKVPKKYEGLDGTELAISESQERMAVVVAKENTEEFAKHCALENLECSEIAEVTDDARMKITWRGKTIVDLSREFLDTNGVTAHTKASVVAKKPEVLKFDPCYKPCPEKVKEKLLFALSSLNGCSKRGLIERFDSTIGTNTVLMPLSGKNQATPTQAMAAKLPVMGNTDSGTVMAYGFDPNVSENSQFFGAMYSVMESVMRVACAGCDISTVRLTLQEYFERMDESSWGKPLSALLGAYIAQVRLKIPAIGGKDSMSGTFMDKKVPPTLVSFAVTPTDIDKVISRELKTPKNSLYVLRTVYDADSMPNFIGYMNICKGLHEAIKAGDVVAASTVANDGIMPTVAKMAFGNGLGVDFSLSECCLFRAMPCSVIIELKENVDVDKYFASVPLMEVGTVTNKHLLNACGHSVSLSEAYEAFSGRLESVFPTHIASADKSVETLSYDKRNTKKASVKIAAPRVIIPVFPGTNCEYDSEAAFIRAGAKVDTVIIRNTRPGDIEESIKELARKIDNSQIIMLPGGFSAGDEPDGSAKFSSTVFRSSEVKTAVEKLLNVRDGLILGICNGFQTLIKLGLVPYGEIMDYSEHKEGIVPTLTYNDISRHQSRIVTTRVSSVLSPWLSGVELGEELSVPISHGEGRFVCDEKTYMELVKNGQIATQYIDETGKASMNIDFNPAGSVYAVEGITSKDGRIFGKMGHSERWKDGLYKNVIGNYDSKIFISGVKYFE